MIKEYIAYLKDNPQGYWFKAKLYGWGWAPVKWQGLLVIAISIAILNCRYIRRGHRRRFWRGALGLSADDRVDICLRLLEGRKTTLAVGIDKRCNEDLSSMSRMSFKL